ncbi:hypothetical protein TCAL_01383 [Tigriopus californicus]|uniref:SMP-30/Gluconolactonase/LRE-like region domain-containing protein n=1 Tax=Tigriopus californicus TaxID=6832 RepID=A0A553NSU8_TIGCA|nr:regucalcin-like [Tigriopus californicus]TRY68489.1 hypothetical protein TCAL_01383 [Tigriopus californicus]
MNAIENIGPQCYHLGEGPHWCQRRQLLFSVDIPGTAVCCYDPSKKSMTKLKIPGESISLIVPIEGQDDEFVISRGRTLSILKWTPGSDDYQIIRDLHEVDASQPKNRLNDGKCDAKGRLWAGTMGPQIEGRPGYVGALEATLYMIDAKGCHVKLTDVELSNGLGWSEDNKTMYFVDSPKRSVDAFDFDLETGDITNRRVFYHLDTDDIPGVPDGLTVDARDNIWLAAFSAGRVLEIDSKTGKLISQVEVPSNLTTSVTFGGKSLDELFVTTGRDLGDEKLRGPVDGSLFVLHSVKVQGRPAMDFVKP